jgi:hypothetical protein
MNDSERKRWKQLMEEADKHREAAVKIDERCRPIDQPTMVGPQVPEEGWEGLPPVRPLEWVPGSLPLHPAPSAESMIKKGEALAALRQAELLDGGLVKGVVVCVNGMASFDLNEIRARVRAFYALCGHPDVEVLVLTDVDQYREVR